MDWFYLGLGSNYGLVLPSDWFQLWPGFTQGLVPTMAWIYLGCGFHYGLDLVFIKGGLYFEAW